MAYLLALLVLIAAFLIWWRALTPPRKDVAARPLLDDPLANTSVSVIRVDADGQIVSLHGGWERLTGWSPGETIGKPYLGFIAAEDRARTRALEEHLRESALSEFSGTARVTARAGMKVPTDVRVYPQREANGRVIGAVLVATPVSDPGNGTSSAFEPAHAGHPSNAASDPDTGRDGTLSRTLAGLAHELNNPLAAITGFAQILLRGSPAADDRHAIETILGEAKRATHLIKDVITVARGDAEMPTARVDLNGLVVSAIAQVRPALEARGIVVIANLQEDELVVEGVPVRMDRIVHNLLRNAQRHLSRCEAPPCELRLTTRRDGDMVVLEVADNGPSLSPESLEHIWDPFAVTGDEADVSGFELAVAHSLVTAQGATIAVRSTPPRGSTFTVTWPAFPAPGVNAASTQSVPGTPPLDVLVVDDEVALRELLSRVLELRGHAVVIAANGEQALRLAEHNTFDVVISDVRMPGIDGPELIRRLRRQPSCAKTRFVLSTGDSLLEVADLARLDVAGVRLIHKPYDVAHLTRLIEAP